MKRLVLAALILTTAVGASAQFTSTDTTDAAFRLVFIRKRRFQLLKSFSLVCMPAVNSTKVPAVPILSPAVCTASVFLSPMRCPLAWK